MDGEILAARFAGRIVGFFGGLLLQRLQLGAECGGTSRLGGVWRGDRRQGSGGSHRDGRRGDLLRGGMRYQGRLFHVGEKAHVCFAPYAPEGFC